MNNAIISTRKTFDGVTVHLHIDGSISTRMWFFRGKLPTATMWREWDDICLYNLPEIPSYIKGAKKRVGVTG